MRLEAQTFDRLCSLSSCHGFLKVSLHYDRAVSFTLQLPGMGRRGHPRSSAGPSAIPPRRTAHQDFAPYRHGAKSLLVPIPRATLRCAKRIPASRVIRSVGPVLPRYSRSGAEIRHGRPRIAPHRRRGPHPGSHARPEPSRTVPHSPSREWGKASHPRLYPLGQSPASSFVAQFFFAPKFLSISFRRASSDTVPRKVSMGDNGASTHCAMAISQ
jgi:hypothetical protein